MPSPTPNFYPRTAPEIAAKGQLSSADSSLTKINRPTYPPKKMKKMKKRAQVTAILFNTSNNTVLAHYVLGMS